MAMHWDECEWDEAGLAACHEGIEGAVCPDVDWRTGNLNGRWAWWVKPMSSRSEYPELFDSGDCPTIEGAMRKAETAMRKADRSYGHIEYA